MMPFCPNCGMEIPDGSPTCPACQLPVARPDSFVGRIVAGRYRLVRRLGQGGMGVVYEAEHVGLGQKVAIKFLHATLSADPEIVRRFRNEARSYAQIVHPHAVQLHDFGQDDLGNLFISMEYLDGADLKRVLQGSGRLPPADALDVALQVADVLGAAHARGIVHRDLKPENVMLTRELRGWHVKVLDFGLAHLADGGAAATAPGMVCGTPRYMAPEQTEGREVDLRVDVYALGLLLFESLTGKHPFESPSVSETMRLQRTVPVPHLAEASADLASLDPSIDRAIQKATAKDRDERFGSMAELARALGAVATGSGAKPLASLAGAGAPLAAGPGQSREPPPVGAPDPSDVTMPSPSKRPEAAAPGTGPASPAIAPSPGADHSLEEGGPSRQKLVAFLTAALVVLTLAGTGIGMAIRRAGIEVAGSRELLDAFYLANGEPKPPVACQEQAREPLSVMAKAAERLSDPARAATRAMEAKVAAAVLEPYGSSSAEASYLIAKARWMAGLAPGPELDSALACQSFAAAENLAGNVRLQQGQTEAAQRHYTSALEMAPEFSKARFNLAVLRFQGGRVDEAIVLLEKVIGEQPTDADAFYALGRVREAKAAAAGQLGDAETQAREAEAARKAFCKALDLGNQKAAAGCPR